MNNKIKKIPISEPDIGRLEKQNLVEAIDSGWVSSLGKFITIFESKFAKFCSVSKAITVSNGTDALVLALNAVGVKPGDEVIVPALTFAAVPAAVKHLGADPVFADVDPEYWCIDPYAIKNAISNKTKAIVVVHSYGHPADIDQIKEFLNNDNIWIIEDCAEAHGAKYKGSMVGTIGDIGTFSFYGNKIITTGEGGMVTTNNENLGKKVRLLKDHAMDSNRRYYHIDVGYNSRMTNLQAAIGCAQINKIETYINKRRKVLNTYVKYLKEIESVRTNPKMDWADPVNWMTSVVLNDSFRNTREQFLKALNKRGVDTRPFFVTLPEMPPYNDCKVFGRKTEDAPESKKLSMLGLNLPTSNCITLDQVEYIGEVFEEEYKKFI